jgi:hypothetical protein
MTGDEVVAWAAIIFGGSWRIATFPLARSR